MWMVVAITGGCELSSYCDTSVIDRRFCIVVRWPKNLMMLEDFVADHVTGNKINIMFLNAGCARKVSIPSLFMILKKLDPRFEENLIGS